MKAKHKILGLMIVGSISSLALAETPIAKPSTHIPFNELIENGKKGSDELQKSVANKMETEPKNATSEDKKKVMDFVDVEVGVGPDRPVVMDRRYNSVGEPMVAKEFSSVKLVDDQPKTETP